MFLAGCGRSCRYRCSPRSTTPSSRRRDEIGVEDVAELDPWLTALLCCGRPACGGCEAVDVVGTVSLLGAFDFLGKAGEAMTPLPQRAQVGEPGAVALAQVFSRHHDRNARRIGNYSDPHYPVSHLVQRDLLGRSRHQLLERTARGHLRRGESGIRLRLPVPLPALLHVLPHLVAQVLKSYAC